jgi:hypothetical protein
MCVSSLSRVVVRVFIHDGHVRVFSYPLSRRAGVSAVSSTRALEQCPGHPPVIASADPLEAIGDGVLDPPQGVLVGGLGGQHRFFSSRDFCARAQALSAVEAEPWPSGSPAISGAGHRPPTTVAPAEPTMPTNP